MRHLTTVCFLLAALLFSVAPAGATPPVFNGNLVSGGMPVYNVRFYGALGVPGADYTTALSNAFNAANSAGEGTIYLPCGIYDATSLPAITSGKVGIAGEGKWCTVLVITTANGNGLSFSGTSGAPIHYNFLRDLTLEVSTPATSAGTGITLSYAPDAIIQNLQVADFITGVYQAGSPDLRASNVIATYSGTGSFTGWAIDGGPGSQGNVSSFYRDCTGAATSSASVGATGLNIYSSVANGDNGDLYFSNFNTSEVGIGIKINFANTRPYSDTSSDIIIRDPVLDLSWTYGVYVTGGDNSTLVKIEGGFFSAATTGSTDVVGVYTNARGLLLEGAEFLPVVTSFAHNTYATQIAGPDAVIEGNSFNGWTRGVYVNGGNNPTILGNRFYSTPDSGSGVGVAMNSVELFNSNSPTVTGNTFSSTAANGMSLGVYLDSTVTNAVVSGNVFYPTADISTLVLNNSTSTSFSANAGYNSAAISTQGTLSALTHNACSSTSGTPCYYTVACSISAGTSCSSTMAAPSGSTCSASANGSDTTTGTESWNLALSSTTLTVKATVSASQTTTAAANVTCL